MITRTALKLVRKGGGGGGLHGREIHSATLNRHFPVVAFGSNVAGLAGVPLVRRDCLRYYNVNQPPTETSSSSYGSPKTGLHEAPVLTEAEEEFDVKMKILRASLNHVPVRGWSLESLKSGAVDLGLSESVSSLCTPFDLVEYFQRSSNRELEKHLKGIDKRDKSLYSSMEYRLKLVVPYISRYHEAMAYSLEPMNVPTSMNVLRELADIICIHGLGDTSTDLRWYAKRSGVISLYIATECCMVQDKSEGFQETWDFLQRRVKDYQFFENAGVSARPFVEAGVTSIMNVLGMNRKR